MTQVVWREDDFETRSLDPCALSSGGANSTIIESMHYLASEREGPDIIYMRPDGTIMAIETRLYASPTQAAVVFLHRWNRHWFHGHNLITFHPHLRLDTGVVLSRASIDELSPQSEPDESVFQSEVDFDNAYADVATHPLTRSAYERLAVVPEPHRQAILLVLNQFLTSLPKGEMASFPSMRLAALDDLSYLLEWTFKDRRLGFSFEADPKESGWYYVYSSDSSERYESGTMDQLEMGRLVGMTLKP